MALAQNASQSSDLVGGVAARAVDGNVDGQWSNGSVTHTALETQAWWEVDLGKAAVIETVRVWNRTDCCSARLRDFYVLVSDVPFASTDLATVLAQDGVSAYFVADTGGSPTAVDVARSGRYVRVQLSLENYLSLAEVEVFGSASSPSRVRGAGLRRAIRRSVRPAPPRVVRPQRKPRR
jgi:hypothetical protein